MAFTQPQVGPQYSDVAFDSKARTNKAAGMQPLQLLRDVDVALAARHRTSLARIGNNDFKITTQQHLVHGSRNLPLSPIFAFAARKYTK